MKTPAVDRINALRGAMRAAGLDACIIPGTDPHQSEYLAAHWQLRAWVSGFHGSAGTLVVTGNAAGLWTDSRYFLEAEVVLEGSGIQLQRMGAAAVIDYPQWLANHMKPGTRVGVDARLVSVAEFRDLQKTMQQNEADAVATDDLVGPLWPNRPPLPHGPASILDPRFAGETRTRKLAELRRTLGVQGATHCLIPVLDDIAWLLNIRGSDIPYNPLALGYVLLEPGGVTLCMDRSKFSNEDAAELEADGVTFRPYDSIEQLLRDIPAGSAPAIDPYRTNMRLFAAVPAACRRIELQSPTTSWKAIKNPVELENIRRCMVRDGAALERFFYWLDTLVGTGQPSERISEMQVAAKLREFRAEGEHFVGESFQTIVGFGDHGAIVHYAVSADTDREIEPDNLLLLDSGAHYLDGTTDITRVVAVGKPTDLQRKDFTLVLKAHIALATALFPTGTNGVQLDAIARSVLWRRARNYAHGTGHGVGYFLNVHEGPQRIAAERADTPLLEGMLTSNEPGLYRTGRYGVRLENLVVTQTARTSDFDTFLRFETVSLCHLDRRLIKRKMLSEEELEWLNGYHQTVYEKLSPHLEEPVARWLAEQTAPL